MSTLESVTPMHAIPIGSSPELLQSAIDNQRIAPAYLFTGRPGIGKHRAALWFAGELLTGVGKPACTGGVLKHPDLLRVEPTFNHEGKLYTLSEAEAKQIPRKSAQVRIEQIRQVSADLQRKPLYGLRSVVIIDEAHTMKEAAANALLKTLEEPGVNVLVLIVNQIERVLPTIVSRCQVVPFYPLSAAEMGQVLTREHPQCLDHSSLMEFAQGSPGQAIQAYRQLQTIAEAGHSTYCTTTVSECFGAAKKIQSFDMPLQMWLLDYWQFTLWNQCHNREILEELEQSKQYLEQHCSPQSVWEVMFLSLRFILDEWSVPIVEIIPDAVIVEDMPNVVIPDKKPAKVEPTKPS